MNAVKLSNTNLNEQNNMCPIIHIGVEILTLTGLNVFADTM